MSEPRRERRLDFFRSGHYWAHRRETRRRIRSCRAQCRRPAMRWYRSGLARCRRGCDGRGGGGGAWGGGWAGGAGGGAGGRGGGGGQEPFSATRSLAVIG